MTLHQLNSLTEDEICFTLYVVNILSPISLGYEIPSNGLTWLRKGVLEKKIQESFPHVKKEAHPIFSSILNKLGVKHEIKYEQPPSGSI